MPCGCFGGGSKKKGSPRDSEDYPRQPRLANEPVKEQKEIPQITASVCQSQPDSREKTENELIGNGELNKANGSVPTTPTNQGITEVDSKSSGAKSRAELYAKRREFFRPLYDVSLNSTNPNQRFTTPRSVNTLPARGKKGGFVIGDETGYFTKEGKFVSSNGQTNPFDGDGGDVLSSDGTSVEGSSLLIVDHQEVDVNINTANRPSRPTSQPSGPAGQWDDILDDESSVPKDEFHQKHHEILQTQHSPSIPAPPPQPEINPHFIEFQEKHHKILHESEGQLKDPKVTQKIVEKKLTELDKLHNEIQGHYEKRMKHGPIDVDSLVERYTEDRWKKMVEMWESEGLIVEGGMVVVDEQGQVVQREINQENPNQMTQKTVSIVKTESVPDDNDRISVVKHTETILVEKTVDNNSQPITDVTVTTVITPPTPQPGTVMEEPYFTTEKVTDEPRLIEESAETQVQEEELITEELVNMPSDENLNKIKRVSEKERTIESAEQILTEAATYQVTSPPSSSDQPQTCTPPPSPTRELADPSTLLEGNTPVREALGGEGAVSATPPPSPPLEAQTK